MVFDKEKTVLITGGLGFIGSNFIRHMISEHPNYRIINLDKVTYSGNIHNLKEIERNQNYTFVQGDICNFSLVKELMGKVNYVINFAAESHVDKSFHESIDFTYTNVLGAHTMFEAARINKIKKFLHIGTDEVYGSIPDENISTNEKTKLQPNNPYSASKAGADMMARAYFQSYKVPIIISRSSNNFGPYQYPEKLMPLCITNALRNLPIPIHGNGKYKRDWMHVTDNCNALDLALHDGEPGEIYNIGTDDEKENLYIINSILKFLDKPQELIRFVKDRPFQDLRYSLDTKKTRALGWKPRKKLDEEISNTITWYKDNEWWWKGLLRKYNKVEEEDI